MTFGGPTPNYHARVRDLCQQAAQMGVFTDIHGFTDQDLRDDPNFWPQHGDFLANHPRGYGYWLWKPYLIHRTLATLQDGDLLIYADAGCTLNPDGAARLAAYLELLRTNFFGMVAFRLTHPERHYTKRALLDGMGTSADQRASGQYMATVVMLKHTSYTLQFTRNWFNMGTFASYHWINDAHGQDPEDPAFRDHRHDQSLYSVLIKTYEDSPDSPPICTLQDETWFHPRWSEDAQAQAFPFWATRNRCIPQTPDEQQTKVVRQTMRNMLF